MIEWKLIDTARKDGTGVVGGWWDCEGDFHYALVWFCNHRGWVMARTTQTCQPDVWCPLPKVPSHDLRASAKNVREKSEMISALRGVKDWWEAQGMNGQIGAPYCMFEVQRVLRDADAQPARYEWRTVPDPRAPHK
jgi:hypothetical protein